MTQYFTVVETQTGRPGVQVARKDVVADVQAILDGKVDQLQPEDLLYIATLKDVEDKINSQSENQIKTTKSNNPPASETPQTQDVQKQQPNKK